MKVICEKCSARVSDVYLSDTYYVCADCLNSIDGLLSEYDQLFNDLSRDIGDRKSILLRLLEIERELTLLEKEGAR